MRQQVNNDIILDVTDLGFATSSLINELLQLRAWVVDQGHRMVICCLDANVRGVLAVTHLDQVFEITDSRQAAVLALHTPKDAKSYPDSLQ